MKSIIIFLLGSIFLFANTPNIYNNDSSKNSHVGVITQNADDIGFIDDITINDREFDELPDSIEFYEDDLKDGKVTVQGLLESEDKTVNVKDLYVEITTDGGNTWTKASGHDEWEWSFSPELGKEYEFSIRVVRYVAGSNNANTSGKKPKGTNVNISNTIMIAGFKLNLNADASLVNGKLSGSGSIEIPYLKSIANIDNKLNVSFENLSVKNNKVTLGDITYNKPFSISTPIADVNVNSITFSPTPANNKLVGKVVFKDQLASSFGEINLPSTSRLLPTSFDLNIPFESKIINIWKEKSVQIEIAAGSLDIKYNVGDTLPTANLNIPSAQFKMGQLLTYKDGTSAQVGLGDFGKMPTVELPKDVYLLDTGIKIPSGLSLSFDLNDYMNPKLTFSSSVNLDGFSNAFAKNLKNANIKVKVLKTGFTATLTGNGGLDPITLLNRGSDAKSVKLLFEGDKPSFSFGIDNSGNPLSFSVSGITPKIQFGDLFTNKSGQSLNKIISLGDISNPTLNISNPMYLLGSKIKLPGGFSASVDLSNMTSPVLNFDVGVDFTSFNNIIAKHISGAKIKGKLSKKGFVATVTSNKPNPIDIYKPKGVKIVFKGETGPSFGVNITGTESLPKFSISDINADLDFGTLLTDTQNEVQSVVASLGVIKENGTEALQLTLPSKVRLLQSNLVFKDIVSSLNLKTKQISINSSVDFSVNIKNPILKALNGAAFDMTISPSAFKGSIKVEDELDPIDIWTSKKVKLTIKGKPEIGVNVNSGGVSFDFGKLKAAINFGDLLTSAQNSASPVIASFSQIANEAGSYSVKLKNEVYLLGSQFALVNPKIDFNPNAKSIAVGSSVNLSKYTSPIVKAFDGASFTASISPAGFSGSLTKNGGFKPIVVLDRGGKGKDVSVEFTSSPTISVEIKNSGLDFGFSGGSADLHFGDLLNNATASINSLSKGVYSWSLAGKNKLFNGAKAYIEGIKNAKLDIQDFTNPKIFFDASIDLSRYGGVLKPIKSANLKNVIISKSGFKASLSASLGEVDIWKEKNVKINFTKDPTINISINQSGFSLGFSDLAAQLYFGDLLNNATASIENVMPSDGVSLANIGKKAKKAVEDIVASNDYSWSINTNNIPLMGSKILLSELGGSIDLSNLSNPSITFNAIADMRKYGAVFKYVKAAQLQNVTISKEGFSGSLITSLQNIPIWREKNVEIAFDESPEFYLKINANGLRVGASNISASVHLGDLLNNSIASLSSLGNDVYAWSIVGKNKLAGTGIYLSALKGVINFADLKDPSLVINSAKISGISDKFKNLVLTDAKISKNGFDASVSADIDDINLYTEGTKKVDLRFDDSKTPTIHIVLTRSNFSVGLTDLSAKIAFTNILNGTSLNLNDNGDGIFTWSLAGPHNFLNDSNGIIKVSDIGGTIDLNDWKNPIVVFHTVADFTNYNFSNNLNLGVADVTRAEIKKTSIKWNVAVENASANFTILELGDGPNDDVRVELKNISGSVSNSGGSVDGADGTLFLGKLFDGNKQIGLTYQTSNGGLKTYGFSFSEDIVYKKDDNNFITLKSPSGQVIETAKDKYKVIFTGQAVARSSILNAISIGELTASNLEVGSSGFKGDIAATFNNVNKSILEGKASISLRGVGFHIDSSLGMPIKLSSFDGDLDLHHIFDESTAKATLAYASATSSINWSFPGTLHVNNNFEFKNLNGTLNLGSLDTLSIGINGNFGYKNINQNIALNSFTIGSQGVTGTIDWTGSVNIFDKLDLKSLGVTFAGVNTSGTLGVRYINNSFLSTGKKLDLGLSATIDKNGIDKFAVDGDLSSINIPNFAVFNFTKVEASPSLKNFWVNLDGTVKPQNTIFKSNVGLEFTNLKISSSGISFGNIAANANISGASADLGPLSVNITELGLGFNKTKNLFYIHGGGGVALDIIGGATAGITVFSDKSVKVDNIAVDIHQSGLVAKGSIAWYDDDEVYGDGFKATLSLGIAEIFTANGLFRIGQVGNTFYWMANASGGIGSGIPMGPLTLYEVGGGIAYHMIYDNTKKDFIPDGKTTSLMLNTTIGTSDSGYLWSGDIKIMAAITDNTLGQLDLDGKSWLLANRGTHPSKRQISAHMTYSPSMFHAWVNANVEYYGITVKGSMDAVFSSSEKHIFIGTDDEYAYAFNVDKPLGHVSVGIFGIDGTGFFMVDTNALAFGEGLYIYKHWSLDWWGPDPSLTFKLVAGAKALIIYNPFQMNIDIYASVGLKACYGACLSIGADVLVKVALPHPEYIWGKAGVHIFGTHITFSGYIYGHGALQEANKAPDLEIFDRVEVPQTSGGASRIPLIKVYSKIQKSQNAISINISNITLRKNGNSANIPINEYALDGDWKGTSIMPKTELKKNTSYVVTGHMMASYIADGKTETKEKDFTKTFTTTSSDQIAFTDIVKSITPTNGDKEVHEDRGVEVTYNKRALDMLGGASADQVQNYKIRLFDSDDNLIPGSFTPPNANLVSKFKSNRDLRVYYYCKNEEGDIRETFVLNGVYLNPFNGYTEDDGNENEPVENTSSPQVSPQDRGAMSVNGANMNTREQQELSMQNILLYAQQSASGNGHTTTIGNNLSARDLQMAKVVPPDLKLGNITFKKPAEALGEKLMSTFSRGKSYTYYRASKYKIKVIYLPTKKVAYRSSFNIRYNNVPAESKRKVEQMSGNLKPTLTVSLDTMRMTYVPQSNSNTNGTKSVYAGVGTINSTMGATGSNKLAGGSSSYNDGFYNEVRFRIFDGLRDIGVYAGIKTKVFVTWEIANRNGVISDVQDELNYSPGGIGKKLLPGIVTGYKDATMRYISEIDNSVLAEVPMDLITGDPFCASCEQQEERERQERLKGMAKKAKQVGEGGMPNMAGGSMNPVGDMDGGFSHQGGGFNPMGDGAFDAAQGNFGANNMNGAGGVQGTHGTNVFGGAQGMQGVGANMNGIGH